MKNLIFVAVLLCLPLTTFAVKYGAGAKGKPTHQIADVVASQKDLAGTFVRVQGKVKSVCPMKGCWMELEDPKTGVTIKAKVKDGVIVFPKEGVGQTALVEGELVARHLSQKQAVRYYAHLAEELGKKFNPQTVKGPVTIYEIKAKGAELTQ